MTTTELLRAAGVLVVAQLNEDDEAAALIFRDLQGDDACRLALTLSVWYATLLHMVCDIGGIYEDDPLNVMQEFLLEQAQ